MVSIILPAYKSKFLAQMLDSLMSQTFKDFELIIVDDASPYNLEEIVSGYTDKRIKYYRNEKNIGGKDLVKNWNRSLEYAKGDLLLLASDDDIYAPTFLEEMVRLADKNPNVDLFHCRVAVIDESGRMIHAGEPIAEYESDIDFIVQRAINRRTQLVPDFVCRTNAIRKLGGFVNYPKAWFSDEMTWYLLAKGKGVCASNKPLFYWRSSLLNISSNTKDTLQKVEASLLHLRKMRELIPELTPSNDFDAYLLEVLTNQIQNSIATQVRYDVEKSSFPIIWRFLRTPKYKVLHWYHFWPLLIINKMKSYVR